MPRGRRPGPGTEEERAAARREKVRLNVQAFRQRKKSLKDETVVTTTPALRWVEATRWQTAYQQQDQEPWRDSTSSETIMSDSVSASTPSSSFAYETPDSNHEDDDALISVTRPRRVMDPDNTKQEHLAMLSIFPSRFLPDRISLPSSSETVDEIRTPCAFWVTTAHSIAKQKTSGPLNDVLLAITTALASYDLGRGDLQIASRHFYQRALQGTRKKLQPIIDFKKGLSGHDDIAVVFLACHAASVFELYINKSFSDMNRHVQGIGLLINHQRKFPGFPSYIGDTLLEEYRMMEINFCFMDRRLSTAHQKTRKLLPLITCGPTKRPPILPDRSIFTTLLDISDHILIVMIQIDAWKPLPSSRDRDTQIIYSIHTLLDVQARLEAWSRYLQHKCTSVLSPDPHDDLDSDNEINISNICSYDYACCLMFCLSYLTYALEEAVGASTLISEDHQFSKFQRQADPIFMRVNTNSLRIQLIRSAGKLAQMMGYFFQVEQGIIGRSLAIWPLEACWNALDNEWARLEIEKTELGLDTSNGDDMVLTETDHRRAAVQKYLQLCREAAAKGRSYGLPLMKERDR